jgi:hypothetical protein
LLGVLPRNPVDKSGIEITATKRPLNVTTWPETKTTQYVASASVRTSRLEMAELVKDEG